MNWTESLSVLSNDYFLFFFFQTSKLQSQNEKIKKSQLQPALIKKNPHFYTARPAASLCSWCMQQVWGPRWQLMMRGSPGDWGEAAISAGGQCDLGGWCIRGSWWRKPGCPEDLPGRSPLKTFRVSLLEKLWPRVCLCVCWGGRMGWFSWLLSEGTTDLQWA